MHPFPSSDSVPHGFIRWRRRRWLALAALFPALWFAPAPSAPANPEIFDEYLVKANLLRIFIQFIEWPAEAFPSTNSPLIIGVMGSSQIGARLPDAIQGETIKGRRIEFRPDVQPANARQCHLLFISDGDKRKVADLLDRLKGASVVTVGETPGFAKGGGVFNLTRQGTRVNFEINPVAAQSQGVKINSRLTARGTVVKGDAPKEGK